MCHFHADILVTVPPEPYSIKLIWLPKLEARNCEWTDVVRRISQTVGGNFWKLEFVVGFGFWRRYKLQT